MNQTPVRIYAFDSLRTIMVLLGIVVHASTIYCLKDFDVTAYYTDKKNHSLFFDLLVDLIHTFRMPVFFVISGFFTAMLTYQYGLKKMMHNRIHRIVYPFIAGIIVIFPIAMFCISLYQAVITNSASPYFTAFNNGLNAIKFGNLNTLHLWFLYYLIGFCLLIFLLSNTIGKWFPRITIQINNSFNFILNLKGSFLIFSFLTILFLWGLKSIRLLTENTFSISILLFLSYFLFFVFGWLLYQKKEKLSQFTPYPILMLLIGFGLFVLRWSIILTYPMYLKSYLFTILLVSYAISIWLFIYGFLGFFFKYCNQYSSVIKYISDGSYWIYLIHLPILLLVQIELLSYNISPFIKFSIGMIVTIFVTVLSYNYGVRNTFIGKFLNGKKQPRGF